jgi:hypothetical protein
MLHRRLRGFHPSTGGPGPPGRARSSQTNAGKEATVSTDALRERLVVNRLMPQAKEGLARMVSLETVNR